jgi:hypothetical protein
VLDGDDWSISAFMAVPPKQSPTAHCIGGWVRPEPVWTIWRRDKSLDLAVNGSPTHQSSSP